MIGQKIAARPGIPFFSVLLLLGAVGLTVAAVVSGEIQLFFGAVPLGLVGGALWLTRRRAFEVEFTETGFETGDPPTRVAYEDVERVLADGKPMDPFQRGRMRFPIHVYHKNGIVKFPPRLEVHSADVYAFLLRQLPAGGDGVVHDALFGYLERELRKFEQSDVFIYGARTSRRFRAPPGRGQLVCAMIVLSSLIWCAIGLSFNRFIVWAGVGGVVGLYTGLFWLALWSIRRRLDVKVPKGERASLVLSPRGLALVQGDLHGQLVWDEVLDVKLNSRSSWFQPYVARSDSKNLQPGLTLKVAGADIQLHDVYDRPLQLIYQQLSYYWRGGGEPDQARDAKFAVRPRSDDDPSDGVTVSPEP
jgi:hypothetical protein